MVSEHTIAAQAAVTRKKRFDLDAFLDYFIPSSIRANPEWHRRARMFMLSHVFGPFLGNVIPLYLFWAGFPRDYRLWTFSASVTAFWIYPLALRATGRYQLLAFISIENLIFCILFACYAYGGIYSPFVSWVLTIPLLAFFYLPSRGRTRTIVLTMISLNFGAFAAMQMAGVSFPVVNLARLQFIGILSTVSASTYVAMMALYYARMLASQQEFEREVREHVEISANLERITDAAKRASAAKSEFVASMSHELRTPLNAVIGYSQLLLEDAIVEADKERVDDLTSINSAGRHLLSLIDDILNFSKIEAGKMDRLIDTVDVPSAIARLHADLATDMRRSECTLATDIAPECTTLTTDWIMVRHALQRLLIDGFAANGRNEIRLRGVALDGGDGIAFTLQGRANGLTPERARSMFSAFATADDVSPTKYGGVGIGLALAIRFINLVEGEISVDSPARDTLRFQVSLPNIRNAAEDDQPMAQAA